MSQSQIRREQLEQCLAILEQCESAVVVAVLPSGDRVYQTYNQEDGDAVGILERAKLSVAWEKIKRMDGQQ